MKMLKIAIIAVIFYGQSLLAMESDYDKAIRLSLEEASQGTNAEREYQRQLEEAIAASQQQSGMSTGYQSQRTVSGQQSIGLAVPQDERLFRDNEAGYENSAFNRYISVIQDVPTWNERAQIALQFINEANRAIAPLEARDSALLPQTQKGKLYSENENIVNQTRRAFEQRAENGQEMLKLEIAKKIYAHYAQKGFRQGADDNNMYVQLKNIENETNGFIASIRQVLESLRD